MQDQRDDSIIGVRSTARLFGDKPRRWLALFAGVTSLCWAIAGYLAHCGDLLRGPGPVALHFAWQIAFLKPDNPADCLVRFKATRRSACC